MSDIDPPPWVTKHNSWLIAIAVSLATFMEVLDTSVANVVLSHVAGSFAASQDESTWALTCYLISNAVILPLVAYLSTMLGLKLPPSVDRPLRSVGGQSAWPPDNRLESRSFPDRSESGRSIQPQQTAEALAGRCPLQAGDSRLTMVARKIVLRTNKRRLAVLLCNGGRTNRQRLCCGQRKRDDCGWLLLIWGEA